MSTKDYIEKDYYKALGVTKDASAQEIKKVYRKLARELHPDKNPGDAKAEARFKEVSEAYDVLADPAKRKEYDEARSLFGSGGFGGFGGGAGGRRTTTNFNVSDMFGGGSSGNLNDLFDGLFGASAGRSGGTFRRASSPGPVRGGDATAEVTLDFEQAVRGVTLPLTLAGPAACTTCHGLGSRPGTAPRTCPNCGGSGFVSRNQGAFGFSEPCVDCRGTGQIIDNPCPDCGGSGATTQTRTINVRIPPGIKNGAKVRVSGKGMPGSHGAPAGDLFVVVHVSGHPIFGRSGDDLTLTVPIAFAEATLGTTLRVPTLDGSVALKIPPGTPSGRTLRVRGRGVQGRGHNGDLLVTVEVAVPQSLGDDALAALETFAAAQTEDPRPEITAALKTPGRTGQDG
jgi:molecular chaperone DnaJ